MNESANKESSGSQLWLTVLLCFGIWFGYLKFFAPPPVEVESETVSSTDEAGDKTAVSGNATAAKQRAPIAGSGSSLVAAGNPVLAKPFGSRSSLSVDQESSRVEFSSVGGTIHKVSLHKYTRTIEKDSQLVSPVEPGKTGLSFSTLFTADELKDFNEGEYAGRVDGNKVAFDRFSPSKVSLSKTYVVDGYHMSADFVLNFPAGSRRDWGYLYIPLGGQGLKYDVNLPLESWQVAALKNEELETRTIDKLEAIEDVQQGTIGWMAFENRYFAIAALNQSEINPDAVFLGNSEFSGGYLRYPLILKEGQKELALKFTFYAGPKDHRELAKIPGLSSMIDFGFFAVVAHPLLWLLNFFYSFVRNYGVAIILLTLFVRVLFYPLTAKSMQSMKSMQKLGPKIKELKEQYKDDRERFAKEQMALFKTHKVNPAAGCLPMLIQMPVFFALYQVLQNSMELFHAPFFWWVQDLSAKDPYYIYPVLMGITMFIQQKMTPAAGMDPMQQKMMLIMPVVFSFIMLSLPSGLTLYIFVSTLLGILQQYQMTRQKEPDAAIVAR